MFSYNLDGVRALGRIPHPDLSITPRRESSHSILNECNGRNRQEKESDISACVEMVYNGCYISVQFDYIRSESYIRNDTQYSEFLCSSEQRCGDA
jgi:hypothetical protein